MEQLCMLRRGKPSWGRPRPILTLTPILTPISIHIPKPTPRPSPKPDEDPEPNPDSSSDPDPDHVPEGTKQLNYDNYYSFHLAG